MTQGKTSKQLVSKVFLSLTYLLFLSVQVCFRYTSDSLMDLDARASSFAPAKHAAPPAFRQVPKHDLHSFLNKRYEPVPVLDLPTQVSEVRPVYSTVYRKFYLRGEHSLTRSHSPALLRGPPSRLA